MSNDKIENILDRLIKRHPALAASRDDILKAFEVLSTSFRSGNKLLLCGNGGSAADSEHIVGELMKSFAKERKLPEDLKKQLIAVSAEKGPYSDKTSICSAGNFINQSYCP